MLAFSRSSFVIYLRCWHSLDHRLHHLPKMLAFSRSSFVVFFLSCLLVVDNAGSADHIFFFELINFPKHLVFRLFLQYPFPVVSQPSFLVFLLGFSICSSLHIFSHRSYHAKFLFASFDSLPMNALTLRLDIFTDFSHTESMLSLQSCKNVSHTISNFCLILFCLICVIQSLLISHQKNCSKISLDVDAHNYFRELIGFGSVH